MIASISFLVIKYAVSVSLSAWLLGYGRGVVPPVSWSLFGVNTSVKASTPVPLVPLALRNVIVAGVSMWVEGTSRKVSLSLTVRTIS